MKIMNMGLHKSRKEKYSKPNIFQHPPFITIVINSLFQEKKRGRIVARLSEVYLVLPPNPVQGHNHHREHDENADHNGNDGK
jgi:hypothetical protein